jgi:hypothetical protein
LVKIIEVKGWVNQDSINKMNELSEMIDTPIEMWERVKLTEYGLL